ncbi:MAG: hypothetical protein FJX30_06305 [Alphaproteobacteria bacterium]|nr:hypothetical protein [Alphaproteobacteria bacterium]
MTKKQLFENILQKEDKYGRLLWYARSTKEAEKIKGVKEHKEDIEKLYPNEVKKLQSERGDWQHGFHSGMVAALRYVLTMNEMGLEQADEEFPMLDS